LKHIVTQLGAHRQDDSQICKGEEKRNVDDSPDYEWNVPRHNSAEDHAATDNQRASPVAPPPDGNCGVHAKDKKQQQTKVAKQNPWIRHADGY
jgi:hypothetical protein